MASYIPVQRTHNCIHVYRNDSNVRHFVFSFVQFSYENATLCSTIHVCTTENLVSLCDSSSFRFCVLCAALQVLCKMRCTSMYSSVCLSVYAIDITTVNGNCEQKSTFITVRRCGAEKATGHKAMLPNSHVLTKYMNTEQRKFYFR